MNYSNNHEILLNYLFTEAVRKHALIESGLSNNINYILFVELLKIKMNINISKLIFK